VRGDDWGKDASGSLRGDQIALAEPLTELADGITRIASMTNPTIAEIRHELSGWNIEDERTINTIARRMKVAASAVREALS
jgi:hypothetical protein